jgi:chaperone LolA
VNPGSQGVTPPGGGAGAPAVTPPPPPPAETAPDASQAQAGAEALRRAASAYGRIRSLRATVTMEQENPLLRRKTNSRGTLMQRRPDRILLRFAQPAGDIIVSDGTHIWVYYPSVDAKQVIRAAAGSGGAGGVDQQAQFVGDPMQRFDYVTHGTETVAGRDADVLTLTPKSDIGYEKLKVWIDRKDGFARRFEITEHNGSIRRFELSDLELNPTLQDDVFEFTPPAGATIVDRG